MKRIVAAPPGSMTNGSRTPIFQTPTDCRIDPRPEKTKTADSTAEVVAESSPSAVAMRNTEEIGVATITSTCWIAKGMSVWTAGVDRQDGLRCRHRVLWACHCSSRRIKIGIKLTAKSICSIVHGATVSVNTRLGFQSALGDEVTSGDGRHIQRSDQAKAKLRATNVPKERSGAIAAAAMAMMPKVRPRAVTAETMPMMMAVIPIPAQRT